MKVIFKHTISDQLLVLPHVVLPVCSVQDFKCSFLPAPPLLLSSPAHHSHIAPLPGLVSWDAFLFPPAKAKHIGLATDGFLLPFLLASGSLSGSGHAQPCTLTAVLPPPHPLVAR
ncbi:hypothetical protein E2C01_019657 [Portunus trituberculatus]|uniref:Uncharacterized protein n=1 Tax=Portunus trituberculatus TaxID=210409 RepID=A0A5B7DZ22_PORTR|nr:hypothetical protein [Portunus trituberculatus]